MNVSFFLVVASRSDSWIVDAGSTSLLIEKSIIKRCIYSSFDFCFFFSFLSPSHRFLQIFGFRTENQSPINFLQSRFLPRFQAFFFFSFSLPHSSVFCIITFFSLSRRRIPTLVAINGGGCRRWENLRPLIPNFISFPPPFFSLFFLSSFPRHLYHHIFLELFGIFFSLWVSLSLFFSLCNHQR